MKYDYLNKVKINFIIGAGRSGTTLLALILNHHPNCISTPELKHFLYFYKKYKNLTEVTNELLADLEKYFSVVGSTRKNILFNIDDNFYIKNLNPGDALTYAQLIKLIYLGFFSNVKNTNEITCIIDKNPFYTFHTEKITEIFPDAKFICIMRDYRAFVLSNRQSQTPFISVRSTSYYAYAWNYHADKIIQLKTISPDKLLIIHYENLVTSKETEGAKVFQYLGVNFTNDVFDFRKTLSEKIAAGNLTGKNEHNIKKISDLSRPINADRVYAWKKNLTSFQLKNIESISSSRGEFFGYKSENPSNLFEKMLYTLIGFPGMLRVFVFYFLNSVKIHHYLNEVRKANFERKHLK